MVTIEFKSERLLVNKHHYPNGRIALKITDEMGFPYMTATVNLPDKELDEEDLTFIKDYSENRGILKALVDADIVEDTGETALTGFVKANIVRVKI